MLAIILGTLAGVVTGLTPGLHINLATVILLSLPLPYSPLTLATFILSMAITHTFLDALPSIYLSAPNADTALLPTKLLLDGKGHEAVRLTTQGSLLCLILGIALTPVLIVVFPKVNFALHGILGWILLGIVLYLLLRERDLNKLFWGIVTFVFAGILGLIVLNTKMNEPLLPLLSGLFGASGMLMNLFSITEVPKQEVTDQLHPNAQETVEATALGTFAGVFIALFPGLGPSQAASLTGFRSPLGSLVQMGGINTVNMLTSLVTMMTLHTARNGAMVGMLSVLGMLDGKTLAFFLSVSLTVAGIATLLTLFLSRFFAQLVSCVNEKALTLFVLGVIVTLVSLFSGWFGLLILFVAASIGLIPQLTNTAKSNSMACILVPVILFLLGWR